MNRDVRTRTAARLLALAKAVAAEDEIVDEEEIDENFVQRVRALRQQLTKLAPKKRRRLKQFGIELIRPGDTVEDLVNAIGKIVHASEDGMDRSAAWPSKVDKGDLRKAMGLKADESLEDQSSASAVAKFFKGADKKGRGMVMFAVNSNKDSAFWKKV